MKADRMKALSMNEGKAAKADILQQSVFSRREWLYGTMAASAAAMAWLRQPKVPVSYLGPHQIEDLVPKKFAQWDFLTASGLILPPKDQLSKLVYDQILTRQYVDVGGAGMALLIAYAPRENGIVQIHRPEFCYAAAGYSAIRTDYQAISVAPGIVIPARRIVFETPIRRETVVYWTRLGDDFPLKWANQRWDILKQNVEGLIPDGLLFRMSSSDPEVLPEHFENFARQLYASTGDVMKHVIAGGMARTSI